MSVSSAYREWIMEQLRHAGAVTSRSMFGGVGLYMDGLFFGLIDDDVLYLKVDDGNRKAFEDAGSGPFRPYGDHRAMQYYEAPADILEDPAVLAAWATESVEAARRARSR